LPFVKAIAQFSALLALFGSPEFQLVNPPIEGQLVTPGAAKNAVLASGPSEYLQQPSCWASLTPSQIFLPPDFLCINSNSA
jgi:hypothetical protein